MIKLLFAGSLLLNSIFLIPALPVHVKKTVHHHQQTKHKETTKFILGAEISNTDVTVGVFELHANKPKLVIEYHAKSQEGSKDHQIIHIPDIYAYVKTILENLKQHHHIKITDACFAIPGIAKGDLFLHPHLPWSTSDNATPNQDRSKHGLAKSKFIQICNLQKVYFINDFQAVALGTQLIDPSTVTILQHGKQQEQKTKLIIGAGNGLGASLLLWDSALNRYIPSQLNYSFTEFGAQSDLELAFFNFMKNKTGNLAWGKVLGAGAGGIKLIYRFFDEYDAAKEDKHKKYKMEKIVDYENYLDIFKHCHSSSRCKDCVDLYVELYARIIRNATYAQNALGGVYITNTVVQTYPELFTTDAFLKKIIDLSGKVLDEGSKNYLENYLKDIPLYVVTDPKVQLYGAAALCIEPKLIRN